MGLETPFAADQLVEPRAFQELVVHADGLHQPHVVDTLDVHVELLGLPVAGVDHFDLLHRDLLVTPLADEHDIQ